LVDFPLLQRLALPITIGAVRYPGIKIHDPRVIRLLEVLLHGGSHVGGWTMRQIHQAVLSTFHVSEKAYGLSQLRYDLRKLKGHGLLQRDGSRYAYRKPGSKLVRAWRGKTHTVLVLADGFEHEGQRYASLTQIASAVTGTHWSGPRFFGLATSQRSTSGRKARDGS
jgi:hypothetical protein